MKNAVALGTFDGVHIGHRAVLAMPESYRRIAVVFRESPKAVLTGVRESILSFEDKCRLLKKAGIQEIVPLAFAEVRELSAEAFLQRLQRDFSPALISCGFNYRFGKEARGDSELLRRFCAENGMVFQCRAPVTADGTTVSSTEIRQLLKEGRLERANCLLTEPFSFTAEVLHGEQRGRTIGFPTINQKYPEELVRLKAGVYESDVLALGRRYTGVTNIGIRPTFRLDYVLSETYIRNFSGDLYGQTVTVVPKRFLRGEVRFSSLKELKNQIARDLAQGQDDGGALG